MVSSVTFPDAVAEYPRARTRPACNEALRCRGALTIRFDPEVVWDATPAGRRGRQQSYSDAAIRFCLGMKLLSDMALHQKALAISIPYLVSRGRLHLLPNLPARIPPGSCRDRENGWETAEGAYDT